MNGTATARDYAWASLAAVVAVLTVLNLAACLYVVIDGDVVGLLRAPVGVLMGYWIGMGAWRRTRWGRPDVDGGPAGDALPARHAVRMTLLAVGCAVAVTLALAVQALLGRS